MVVVLPAPLCPSRAVIWPRPTSKSRPSTATWRERGRQAARNTLEDSSNTSAVAEPPV